jgi:hypothetical protein
MKLPLLILLTLLSLHSYAQSNFIYGLWVEDATDLTFLASTDPMTGVILPIDTLNKVDGIVTQTGTINSQMLVYTFRYLSSGGYGLMTLALSNGAVVYDVPSVYNVVGLKYACNGVIYGLWKDTVEAYHFVSIDAATGDQADMGIIPGLSGIFFGTFSFDINNQWYMFRGIDSSNVNRLYSIDTQDGSVVNAPVSNDNVRGNEYDCVTQITYGAWNDPTNDFEYFVSVDPLTGAFDLIDSLYTVSALISETYSLNHNTGRYTFAGLQGPFYHLFTVDVISGNVVTDVAIDDVITETDQVSCCGKGTLAGVLVIENVSVYPNPADDYLVLEGNFITETLIKCYNLRGEEIFIQRAAPAKTMIDLTGLEPGFYLIQISNEETAAILKFVKR